MHQIRLDHVSQRCTLIAPPPPPARGRPAKVDAARLRYAYWGLGRPLVVVASQYGVSLRTASRIVNFKVSAHVV